MRASGTVSERVGDANLVELHVVGTLVCLPHDMEDVALLNVPLVDERGKAKTWGWHLTVIHDWPDTECLPGDFVSVQGRLVANGEGEPMLGVRRVRLLRRRITGEPRKHLLQCKDPVERWHRAMRRL